MYKLITFLGNAEFYPETNAWFISSTTLWLNALLILNFVELRLGRALTNTVIVIIVYLLFLIFTFTYLFRKERFKKIIEKYKVESPSKRLLGSLSVFVYIAIIVIFHLYFSELRRAMAFTIK